jgi:hypothetical protein
MLDLLDEWVVASPEGGVELRNAEPLRVGLVTWRPA